MPEKRDVKIWAALEAWLQDTSLHGLPNIYRKRPLTWTQSCTWTRLWARVWATRPTRPFIVWINTWSIWRGTLWGRGASPSRNDSSSSTAWTRCWPVKRRMWSWIRPTTTGSRVRTVAAWKRRARPVRLVRSCSGRRSRPWRCIRSEELLDPLLRRVWCTTSADAGMWRWPSWTNSPASVTCHRWSARSRPTINSTGSCKFFISTQ